MADSSLRVCLLSGFETVPRWFADAMRTMLSESATELSLIAIRERDAMSPEQTGSVKRAAKWLLKGSGEPLFGRPSPWVPVNTIVENPVETTTYSPTTSGVRIEVPTDVVEKIALNCDVVVQTASGILTGDILTKPELGVLSFHHGNLREYRGGPPGFWEFVHGRDAVGITLQRLTETLDGGEIIYEKDVDITDCHTWKDVLRKLYTESEPILATGLTRLRDPQFTPTTPDEMGDLYKLSDMSARVRALYILKTVWGLQRR